MIRAGRAGSAKISGVGFLDVITGRRKLAGPAPDRLFAMSTAYVTLESQLNIRSRGGAAIVFQPLATVDFESIVTDMEEVVRATAKDSGTQVQSSDDRYGYRWLVLKQDAAGAPSSDAGPGASASPAGDFDDLVVNINAVSGALESGGYGERVLCAVFSFQDAKGRPLYWIYNYKRGSFYPFVPAGGAEQRDNERELVLKAQIGADLPVEPELSRWFPLWGIPI
jgi:hypothetical protein